MIDLPEEQIAAFQSAVHAAAKRADVACAVENVYHALQDAIDLRRPVCNASGRCCRFDEFGHRLFITTLELAAFFHVRQGAPIPPEVPGGCAFQVGGLCTVHAIRPFGCRVYFCDASATEWQHKQYERFHAELKRLHLQFDVPYYYVEWRAALRILGKQAWTVGQLAGRSPL